MTVHNKLTVVLLLTAGITIGHAALAWSPFAAVAFVGLAVSSAFLAEAAVVRLGLLRHATGPQLLGVPIGALAGWLVAIYIWYRVALLVLGVVLLTPVFAGALATAFDLLVDPRGVDRGLWRYPESRLSRLRFRGVPWWNFVGWFLLTTVVTAVLQTNVLG